jgi:hypothetical protein
MSQPVADAHGQRRHGRSSRAKHLEVVVEGRDLEDLGHRHDSSLERAVVMRRERIDNRWQPWRWALDEIVPHEEGFGATPRLLLKDEREERWLHPGFKVELFTDDAEGYYLNASTAATLLLGGLAHGRRSPAGR